MATVAELSAPYGNFMFGPRPGRGVCRVCFNLTDGWERCYACAHGGRALDAVAPISYSVAGEQLHHALAGYKRAPAAIARELALGLGAVLWRWLDAHERCVARAAGVRGFPVVTTVPSGDRRRAETHALRSIVAELVGPSRDRYRRLLQRSAVELELHRFDESRYETIEELDGSPVLLIDDTWTTGANAQSAAAALKRAGSGPVAAVVIGRHLNRCWGHNDERLQALPSPFDWSDCALCARSVKRDAETHLGCGSDRDRSCASSEQTAPTTKLNPPVRQQAEHALNATRSPVPVASCPTRSPPPRWH